MISNHLCNGECNIRIVKALHTLFPEAAIYAFEPIKREGEKILLSKNVVVENLAISDKAGKATLYNYGFSPESSLLPATPEYAKKLRGLAVTEKEIVGTTTLDTYLLTIFTLGKVLFLRFTKYWTAQDLSTQGV